MPAILEYIPYRKNDATSASDALRHPYFAGHGYASVRVDIRGSGDSEGLLLDEYLPQEQEDALDVLAWLSNSLVHGGSRDDGLLVGRLQLVAGGRAQAASAQGDHHRRIRPTTATAATATTPGAAFSPTTCFPGPPPWLPSQGGRRTPPWSVIGGARCGASVWTATEPFVHAWLSHQLYDEYWKQGSVCEDYDAIECPVFAVGGWHDPYRDTVLHLLAGLGVPRWASSARGHMATRTRHCRAHRSVSIRSACGGGTTGSRERTRESWTSRCCGPMCSTITRLRRSLPSIPGTG